MLRLFRSNIEDRCRVFLVALLTGGRQDRLKSASPFDRRRYHDEGMLRAGFRDWNRPRWRSEDSLPINAQVVGRLHQQSHNGMPS